MKKFITKFIQECTEEFIKQHPMDAVDVCVVDNFSDYIIERLEIMFYNMDILKKGDK